MNPDFTNTPLRTRFAPSPTGYLHTGGVRTALFSWLVAKQTGGQFVLRIEDTDEQRSTEESTRAILDGMSWLGLTWDEGPDPNPARFGESFGPAGSYFQSQRAARHLELLDGLIKSGKAFYCPATAEEMAGADGKKLLLSPYRDLSYDEQQARLSAAGGQLPVRFKCPLSEEVAWDDAIRGRVSFKSDEIGDFIFVKSNGKPLYNFAVVCDDADMRINLVLRGEDHISNTPKQIMLYHALGFPEPRFGHAPLIVGMDRARLSKRHGATQVGAYRELGVLPEALVNFLALIGWAPSGNSAVANQEVFTREELIEYFHIEEVGKSAGAFNIEKLTNMNGLHLRALSPDAFFEAARPFLPEEWLKKPLHPMELTTQIDAVNKEIAARDILDKDSIVKAKRVMLLYQDKLTLLSQARENVWYFFERPRLEEPAPDADGNVSYVGYYNPKAVAKFLTGNADAPAVLKQVYAAIDAVPAADWDEAHLHPAVDVVCEALGLGKGKVMQPWRVAITGDTVSPGFFDLLAVLGKDETLARVKPWVEKLG
jgi:glutamyl-tRNA synthetase